MNLRGPANCPGAVRMAALAQPSAAASTGRGSRPCAERTSASSQGKPSRANASATDEGAGTTLGAMPRSVKARTIPKKPGSPDASTATGPGWDTMALRAAPKAPSELADEPPSELADEPPSELADELPSELADELPGQLAGGLPPISMR